MVTASKHILLAEDDTNTRLLLSNALRAAGYKVTAADNGKNANMQINSLLSCKKTIDLMVLDIFMPGMNGVELIDLLAEKNISLPIIVITGYTSTDLSDRLIRKGCLKVLHKPFKASELIEVVQEVLCPTPPPA